MEPAQRPNVEVTVNGHSRQIAEGTSVAELLDRLALATRYVAVEVNRQLVPREGHARHRLNPGDRVEVVTLVGGG